MDPNDPEQQKQVTQTTTHWAPVVADRPPWNNCNNPLQKPFLVDILMPSCG